MIYKQIDQSHLRERDSICFNTFIDWSLPCLKASRHEICADFAAGSQSRGNRLGRKMVQNSEAQMGHSETPKMDEQWMSTG